MNNSRKWQRAELLLFTIITLLNLLPYISTRFFPSMDGASHLSNSNIINQLVFHHNELFRQFFTINPEPVPNWTSHLLISLLSLVMPAFLAEKILMVILLAGTPFAFRSLMQTISPGKSLYSYLIFPFTHSMFLFFGFYNFCLAVLFFLITLNYWLRNEHKFPAARPTLFLALLAALTYFSHLVVFGALLIMIAVKLTAGLAMDMICRTDEKRAVLAGFLKKTLAVTLAALIPLILFVYFFYSRPGTREISHIAGKELAGFLVTVRSLISFNATVEGRQTTILFIMLALFAGIGFIAFLIRLVKTRNKSAAPEPGTGERLLPGLPFWWLLTAMAVLLALYFTMPDAYGTASYTNLRLGYLFFLASILWISTFRIPWQFGLIAIAGGIYVNTMLNRIYAPTISELGKLASDCNKGAAYAEPNSVVLPIYCMDNWFTGHFVDYLSVDKPILMVYNYECHAGYFPVKWNEEIKPNYYLGDPSNQDHHINFELVKGRPSIPLDYVFIVGHYDPGKDWFFSTLHRILTEDFVRVYEAENCSLYRNKPHPKSLPIKGGT